MAIRTRLKLNVAEHALDKPFNVLFKSYEPNQSTNGLLKLNIQFSLARARDIVFQKNPAQPGPPRVCEKLSL